MKMSESMKGKNKGKTLPPRSEEHCMKMSESMKGNTCGKGNKGKTHTEEVRMKLSDARKGFITALNIETGEVRNIPTSLYHSRRDIYFTHSSKVFKEWKEKPSSLPFI